MNVPRGTPLTPDELAATFNGEWVDDDGEEALTPDELYSADAVKNWNAGPDANRTP